MAATLQNTEEMAPAIAAPAPPPAGSPATSRLRAAQVWTFARANPLPAVALVGLTAGAILQWGLALPEAAWWTSMATVVVGGAPLVLQHPPRHAPRRVRLRRGGDAGRSSRRCSWMSTSPAPSSC